jgi:hypothetical protein
VSAKRRVGRPAIHDTELARLRERLNMSQAMAAVIAAGLLGSCDVRTWRDYEAGRTTPPVILAHFRRLVDTLPVQPAKKPPTGGP